mmetsp:Transcript_34694/g.53199  ORF Transcript_34694/g.53199 Transcript_34694/m.53199 type:complete len:170 (-) Transcript_34694:2318-2827(-)
MIGDRIYVRLGAIKEGGKLSLEMKNISQDNGEEIVNLREMGRKVKHEQFKLDPHGRKIGVITGVLLEDSDVKIGKGDGLQALNKRMPRLSSPDMWEMKQLKGGQALHLVKGAEGLGRNFDEIEEDPAGNYAEEYTELELNEDDVPFLRGQGGGAGTGALNIVAEPIKIS